MRQNKTANNSGITFIFICKVSVLAVLILMRISKTSHKSVFVMSVYLLFNGFLSHSFILKTIGLLQNKSMPLSVYRKKMRLDKAVPALNKARQKSLKMCFEMQTMHFVT